MKKTIAFTLVLLTSMASAQTMKEWDDVKVSSLNRVTSHDLSIPFSSVSDALSLDLERSPYYESLNA